MIDNVLSNLSSDELRAFIQSAVAKIEDENRNMAENAQRRAHELIKDLDPIITGPMIFKALIEHEKISKAEILDLMPGRSPSNSYWQSRKNPDDRYSRGAHPTWLKSEMKAADIDSAHTYLAKHCDRYENGTLVAPPPSTAPSAG